MQDMEKEGGWRRQAAGGGGSDASSPIHAQQLSPRGLHQ